MIFETLIKRILLRKTAFNGAYNKLSMLYNIEDPWNLSSEGEAHRFTETERMLKDITPHFGSILELGSGEGHQSTHLLDLADSYHGIELSPKAVARARQRCPEATFSIGRAEQAGALTNNARFDLITACEVLYYLPNAEATLADLTGRTRYLFVSNYLTRAEVLRPLFQGPGWQTLPNITYGDTLWECALWSRDAV